LWPETGKDSQLLKKLSGHGRAHPGSEPRSRRLRIGSVDVVAHDAHDIAGSSEALHDGHDGRDIPAEMSRCEQEVQWLAAHDKRLPFAGQWRLRHRLAERIVSARSPRTLPVTLASKPLAYLVYWYNMYLT